MPCNIDAVLADLLECAPEDRDAFVVAAARGDEACLTTLRALLRELDDEEPFLRAGGALEGPFGEDLASDLERDEGVPAGERVGPYRIVGEIGRGGMGVVYLAERVDGVYSQQVALKVVRRGIDTDEALTRFRQERQILASLEHPGIARLLDGGVTADGRPYFAMDLVVGEPIDRHCERRDLDIDARIDLCVAVARVVQHAHRRLVVHRDLKPGNVFVTEEGEPRLLDFGIAKLLDPALAGDVAHTHAAVRVMTPQYASPEQVRGEAITTASDVYQMGLLVFEVLTGQRAQALDGLGPTEVERVVCEQPPPRPSAAVAGSHSKASRLRRTLRGDLDRIVLKALHKEPDRRYGSVEHLADDLVRYRRGQPVSARGDSLRYRAGMFLRRHRLVTAAAVSVVVLVATIVAFYSARLASERDRAQLEAATANQVAGFLVGLFEASDPTRPVEPGAVTVRELLDRGAARIDSELADQPAVQEELMTVVGRVYTQLGLYDRARTLVETALERRQSRNDGEDARLADSLEASAWVDYWTGNFAVARTRAQGALEHRARVLGPDHLDVATLHGLIGRIDRRTGEFEGAREHLTRSLEIRERHLLPDDLNVAASLQGLGALAYREGDVDTAIGYYQRTLEIYERSLHEDDVRMASIIGNLIQARMGKGDYEGLEPLADRARTIFERRFGPDHREVGTAWLTTGGLYFERGRYAEAALACERALSIYERSVGAQHLFASYAHRCLGDVHRAIGDPGTAARHYERAVAIRRSTPGGQGALVFEVIPPLGIALVEAGRPEEAELVLRPAIDEARGALAAGDTSLGYLLVAFGSALIERGRAEEAGPLVREGIETLRAGLTAGGVGLAEAESAGAVSLLAQGRFAEAEPVLLASLETLRARDDQRARATARRLARLYDELGQGHKAGEQRAFLARIDAEARAEQVRLAAAPR